MRFSKWHALGNSYLVVEQPDAGPIESSRAQRLCDPRHGIGSDGVLEVVERSKDRIAVVIWNPDGSIAEMSGNGVRIAGCWLAAETGATEITVTTSGREIRVSPDGEGRASADHGPVEVGDPESLDVSGELVELVAVSVGNPHAVVRMTQPSRDDLLRLGPLLETHVRFPDRTNVQLVRVDGQNDLDVLVWERGAGETASSGSSSIAAAAVAVARGWCRSPVTVHLPGGVLEVTLEKGRAGLAGPADVICRGTTRL